MLTIEQAKKLKPGTMISFNGPDIFKVTKVESQGLDVKITLEMENGDETFATTRDLEDAQVRGGGEPPKKTEPEKEEPATEPVEVKIKKGPLMEEEIKPPKKLK